MWFKGDDGWHKHRKRIRCGVDMQGMAAQGLWFAAGTWSADELTDGWVPDYIVDYLAPGIGRDLAKRLEAAKLWHPGVRDGEEGWQFHQWTEHQRTREQVMAERSAAAERQANARKRANEKKQAAQEARHASELRDIRGKSDRDAAVSNGTRHAVTNGVVTGAVTADVTPPSLLPDQTRPDQTVGLTDLPKEQHQTLFPEPPTASGGQLVPATRKPTRLPDSHRFDEFWSAYPHKRDKDDGRRAWAKVVRESQRAGTDVVLDDVIAAAGFYRHSKEFTGGYAKHPATFLNKGSWRDFVSGPPAAIVPVADGAGHLSDGRQIHRKTTAHMDHLSRYGDFDD